MSEKRFLSVSDRFVFDLEKLPQKINHEDEARLYLLISGMKYLKLNHYPPELFEDSKEFIQILAKFLIELRTRRCSMPIVTLYQTWSSPWPIT